MSQGLVATDGRVSSCSCPTTIDMPRKRYADYSPQSISISRSSRNTSTAPCQRTTAQATLTCGGPGTWKPSPIRASARPPTPDQWRCQPAWSKHLRVASDTTYRVRHRAAHRTPLHPPQTAGWPAPILAAATTQRAVRAPVGALPPRMGTWLPRKARGGRRLGWSARAWGVPCSALL